MTAPITNIFDKAREIASDVHSQTRRETAWNIGSYAASFALFSLPFFTGEEYISLRTAMMASGANSIGHIIASRQARQILRDNFDSAVGHSAALQNALSPIRTSMSKEWAVQSIHPVSTEDLNIVSSRTKRSNLIAIVVSGVVGLKFAPPLGMNLFFLFNHMKEHVQTKTIRDTSAALLQQLPKPKDPEA